MDGSAAIFVYQAVIGGAILISSLLGRKALGVAVVCASVWTATHIVVPWLVMLQFITIGVSGLIGLVVTTLISIGLGPLLKLVAYLIGCAMVLYFGYLLIRITVEVFR